MKEKIKHFLKTNYIPLTFLLLGVIIELVAVLVTSGKFYVRNPIMWLSILGALTVTQFFILNQKARYIYSCIALLVLMILDLVFIVIYDMTGTIFDFSMLQLRNDGMAIIEKLPINFAFTSVAGVLISLFIVFGARPIKYVPKPTGRLLKVVLPCALSACLLAHGIMAVVEVGKNDRDDYLAGMLYERADSLYSDRGIIGNLATEMYKSAFDKVEVGSLSDIESFVYENVSEPTSMFGKAKDYNVVTVLCESFEWFSFISDLENYPNGHTADESKLRELFPNLYEFFDHSIVMTNYHSREKTDVSENLSLMGSYPLTYYTNYDYPTNSIPYSLPNTMENLYGVPSNSFHNGTNSFYNRNEYLVDAIGFDAFISSEQMVKEGVMVNHDELGEYNLDSEMIASCNEKMFPTDKRFNTYITTITMHGQYTYRENLQPYYDKLDASGVVSLMEGTTPEAVNNNCFYHYVATAMEFDKAIGTLTNYLDEKGLTDNTLVVLFSDHNTYYNSQSNYIKDIDLNLTNTDKDVTELYRVPLMVKIGKGEESTVYNDKFVCTADILPTIMDLLGIKYFSNVYYGNSFFAQEETVLYSRAYNMFLTDKMYFTTLNNIKYKAEDADDDYVALVESRAKKLLKKTSYINRIFACDFFTGERLNTYERRMKTLNQIS